MALNPMIPQHGCINGFGILMLCPKSNVPVITLHKVLLVKGTSLRRGMIINPPCPICSGDTESIEYLFSDFHMVKKVWELGVAHHWSPPIFSPLGCYDFSQCMDKVQSSQNPKLKKKTFISPMEHLEAYKFNSFQK